MSQWRNRAFHFPPAASQDALSLIDGDALGSVELWRAHPAKIASKNSTETIAFIVPSVGLNVYNLPRPMETR